ncbi:uncharacterized protein V1513DRAFT_479627 [Lipomyces chichibuensis]|uniref:uncharacterized protein n=1 Tax=Lipomyces chichibuensis TaxID=1546026 RepID=UPI003343F9BC
MQRLRAKATCAVAIAQLVQPTRALVAVQQWSVYFLRRTYTTRSRCLLASDTGLGRRRHISKQCEPGRFIIRSSFQNAENITDKTTANTRESESSRTSKSLYEYEQPNLHTVGFVEEEPGNRSTVMGKDREINSETESLTQSHNALSTDERFPPCIESVAESAAFDPNKYDAMSIFDSSLQQSPEDFLTMQVDDSYLFKNLLGEEEQISVDSFVRRYNDNKAKVDVLENLVGETDLYPAEEIHFHAQAVEESPPATWINLPDSKVEEIARQALGKMHVNVRAFVSAITITALRRDKNKLLKELRQSCDVRIQLESSLVPFDKQGRVFQVSGTVENVAKTFASLSRIIQNVSLSGEDRQLRLLLIVTYRVAGGISRDPQTIQALQRISSATITVSQNLLYHSTDRILIVTAHNNRSLYLAVWEISKFIAPPDWIHEASAISKTRYQSYVGVRPPSARLTNRRQRQINLDRSNPMKLDEESARLKSVTVTIPKMHVGFVIGKHGSFQTMVREKTGAYVTIHPHRSQQTVTNALDGRSISSLEVNASTMETGNNLKHPIPDSGDFVCVIKSREWSRVNRAAFLYRNRIQLAEARYRRIKNDQLI